MKKVAFDVQGMTCGGCARAVEKIILKNAPDSKVTVDLAKARVETETSGDPAQLAAALTQGGFAAKLAA